MSCFCRKFLNKRNPFLFSLITKEMFVEKSWKCSEISLLYFCPGLILPHRQRPLLLKYKHTAQSRSNHQRYTLLPTINLSCCFVNEVLSLSSRRVSAQPYALLQYRVNSLVKTVAIRNSDLVNKTVVEPAAALTATVTEVYHWSLDLVVLELHCLK